MYPANLKYNGGQVEEDFGDGRARLKSPLVIVLWFVVRKLEVDNSRGHADVESNALVCAPATVGFKMVELEAESTQVWER